jgi:hypothetical protein
MLDWWRLQAGATLSKLYLSNRNIARLSYTCASVWMCMMGPNKLA